MTLDALTDKVVLARAVARAQTRNPAGSRVVPVTFAMPDDDEALWAAAADGPSRRWVQRPRATTHGAATIPLADPHDAERGTQWVVQQDMNGRPARCHVVIVSLEPLLVYVAATADSEPIARAATTAVVAAREPLLRAHAGDDESALVGVDTIVTARSEVLVLEIDAEPADAEHLRSDAEAIEIAIGNGQVPERKGALVRTFPTADAALTNSMALARPADVLLAEQLGLDAPTTLDALAPSAGVRVWMLDLDMVIHSPALAEMQVVNSTGAYVWLAWADGLEPHAIASDLALTFDVAADEAEASVWNMLGEWADQGVLVPERRLAPPAPEADWEAVAHIRWNIDRVYRCLDRHVAVRLPTHEVGDWLDRALGQMAVADPPQIDAIVEVGRANAEWVVRSTHHAPASCPTAYQLVPLVRRVVLAAAARVSDVAVVQATALAGSDAAVIVLGLPTTRAAIAAAWLATGGRVLADELIRFTDVGAIVPARVGMQLVKRYQWIDGTPLPAGAPGAPNVDDAGRLVRFWTPPISAMAELPLMAPHLVLAGYGDDNWSPCAKGEALVTLVASRPPGRRAMSAAEAAHFVSLVQAASCYESSAAKPAALVDELRGLLEPHRA